MALSSEALRPQWSEAHRPLASPQQHLPHALPSFRGSETQHRAVNSSWGSCLRLGRGARRLTVVAEGTQAPVAAAASVAPFAAAASVAPSKEGQHLKVPSSFEYNQLMKKSMANPYEYHHELGMSYTRIGPHIILGSQPQGPEDVTRLAEEEGVGAILNVQEDKDMAYWKVDLPAVMRRCQELGVEHHRRPAVDFDPNSLRQRLPGMVGVIARCVAEDKTVYVHCTAGLGRSPAAVIAYLFWFSEPRVNLQKAYDFVTGLRPCGPKWEAIRGATYDLAKNSPYQPAFEALPKFALTDVSDFERNLIRERALHC